MKQEKQINTGQKIVKVEYTPNDKQRKFHACEATEVVYGGAKGGGKSCALVMEALAYALENAGAIIYLFRETYDDLEANLIREWKSKVPKELYKYSETKHICKMINGSEVYFRYITSDADAEGYQGRSIDFIGVDELTKHTERTIQIILSCLRSPKGFRPVFKGTCNPGGIGHNWVKDKYIIATDYGEKTVTDNLSGNTISFIPATVYDNEVLMKNDPSYVRRLENLPESEKKAFLYGDWDLFEGQYFGEVKRDIHIKNVELIEEYYKKYVSIDYGLDMLAVLWYYVDNYGYARVYRELYRSNLIISDACKAIKEAQGEDKIYLYLAPPDLWNRRQETGKSAADIFRENGIYLTKTNNDRVNGWLAVKEWIKPVTRHNEQTGEEYQTARLTINQGCAPNLWRCLTAVQSDKQNPNDVAGEPHELTHILDSLRCFCIYNIRKAVIPEKGKRVDFTFQREETSAFGIGAEPNYYEMTKGW